MNEDIKHITDRYQFAVQIQVRDYELDYQGIVNNANYLHYLEHTRHEFCRSRGVTFAEMHRAGIDPVLSRIDAHFKQPLRADDWFWSCLILERRGPRFVFVQDIYRTDGTPVLTAEVTIACLEDGHASRGERLAALFDL